MIHKCPNCLRKFEDWQWINHNCKEQRMTRDEAREIVKKITGSDVKVIECLEALGLLKFDEPELRLIFKLEDNKASYVWGENNRYVREIIEKFGVVRLELWPEGLVLWVGGEIKWKSWEKYYNLDTEVGLDGTMYKLRELKIFK